jgi:hypothetical protein
MSAPSDKVFTVARALDPIVGTPFTFAHSLVEKSTVNAARRVPLYVWLRQEEARINDAENFSIEDFTALTNVIGQQEAIEDAVSPFPRTRRCLRSVAGRRLATESARDVLFAWQRLTRGWDDRSLWSLDWYVCRTLGAQLTQLADTTHGWPQSDEYPTFEDWQAALRTHGSALTEAANTDITEGFENTQAAYVQAQESLRWVADNLGDLWD